MPGPPPKRAEERRRRVEPTLGMAEKVEIGADEGPQTNGDGLMWGDPDPSWSDLSRRMWRAIKDGPIARRYYTQSDVVQARLYCTMMTEVFSTGKINAQLVMAMNTLGTELLLTEGARRKSRLELERRATDAEKEKQSAIVKQLAAYREMAK